MEVVLIVIALAVFGVLLGSSSAKRKQKASKDLLASSGETQPIRWEIPRTDRPSASRHVVPQPKVTPATMAGRCWVIDGDTIVIDKVHIRLAGIDAPELDHPYGQKAKRALMELCKGQVITAVMDGTSTFERAVAQCFLPDGRDLAAEMVMQGHAIDWAKHSGGRYRHLETDDARKRLWRSTLKQQGRMPPQTPN